MSWTCFTCSSYQTGMGSGTVPSPPKVTTKASEVRLSESRGFSSWGSPQAKVTQGLDLEQVAQLLDICPRTIRNWLDLYLQGGTQARSA